MRKGAAEMRLEPYKARLFISMSLLDIDFRKLMILEYRYQHQYQLQHSGTPTMMLLL